MKKNYIYCLLIFMFCISCKDEYTICDLPTTVRLKAGFYSNSSGSETETSAPLLNVVKLGSPTADYHVANASKFSLALNPILDSVTYIVSLDAPPVEDTVTFVYSSQKVNISANCGDVYVNSLARISTTTHAIDSIKISNNTVNTTSGENVKIYF